MVSFFVPGVPVPKGGINAFFNKKTGQMHKWWGNAEKQKPWVSLISLIARKKGVKLTRGGMSLELSFFMPRPKNHFGSGKNAGKLKDSAPQHPTTKPDLDKLVRCVGDALTGIAWNDDSQLVNILAHKQYSEQPGVQITIAAEG